MAIEALADNITDHQEIYINKVFDFNSFDVVSDDLGSALHDITSELHKYMKWFRVLSRDHSLPQDEKRKYT